MHRPRAATLSALNCLFVHHLAARPESLGIIAWLLHCSSLAACAKDMAGARPRLVVAMSAEALCLPLCQTTCLSASSTCLQMCVHTWCQAFQVDHFGFILFALNIFIPTSQCAK
jgi:hypothetical protein